MSDDDVSNKRRRLVPHMVLLEYPFLMPIVLQYLDDEDVLTRLLLTGKSIKPCLTGYTSKKCSATPELADEITGWNLYLPMTVDEIYDWNGEDLRSYSALKRVCSSAHFNKAIGIARLPISLIYIYMSDMFDQSITRGMFPPSMTEIRFGNGFNHPIPVGALPPTLRFLQLGDSYNQRLVSGVIPHSVTSLSFAAIVSEGSFNQPVLPGVLPSSLTSLFTGAAFNQPLLPNALPASLSKLVFGTCFNQRLTKNVMPSKLICLYLGSSFASALFMPPTLQLLHLSCPLHNISIIGCMPMSLTEVNLAHASNDVLPAGLLPGSLRTLTIQQLVVVGSIPVGVTDLHYASNHAVPAAAIPTTVSRLMFCAPYNLPVLPGVIPDSVIHLQFGSAVNQLILPHSIPSSVTDVFFGDDFNTILMPGVLPDSVTKVDLDRLNGCFNQPLLTMNVSMECASRIIGSIPQSVTQLILSRDFDQSVCFRTLLPNAEHLAIGKNFSQPLTCDVLPTSLQELVLPEDTSYRFEESECIFDVHMSDQVDGEDV